MTTLAKATVTRRFKASAERVFDAFLDPAKAGKFLFATKDGEMVRVEIDARVGGAFVFTDRRDGEDFEHSGKYLEIDRPRRLVFTLLVSTVAEDPGRVTIEITPDGNGCEVVLSNEMTSGYEDLVEGSREGWAGILESLARTLGEAFDAKRVH